MTSYVHRMTEDGNYHMVPRGGIGGCSYVVGIERVPPEALRELKARMESGEYRGRRVCPECGMVLEYDDSLCPFCEDRQFAPGPRI